MTEATAAAPERQCVTCREWKREPHFPPHSFRLQASVSCTACVEERGAPVMKPGDLDRLELKQVLRGTEAARGQVRHHRRGLPVPLSEAGRAMRDLSNVVLGTERPAAASRTAAGHTPVSFTKPRLRSPPRLAQFAPASQQPRNLEVSGGPEGCFTEYPLRTAGNYRDALPPARFSRHAPTFPPHNHPLNLLWP